MWSLVNEVADQEKHEGVLRFFIAGPMWPLSRKFPERCAGILSGLLEQKWAKVVDGELNGRDEFVETSSNLVAFLYVSRNQPAAWAWIERWANDLRRGGEYLTQMLHHLRQVFFLPYGDAPNPEKIAVAERARRLLDLVVGAAASAIIEARPHLLIASDEATAAAWRPLYVTADRLIDQACSQLYFGSGAFRSPGDTDRGPGLSNPEAKQRFLAEFSPVLDLIAAHAQSRTVYNLFELLDYLAEGDPKGVFDRIAKILLGPASEDGYQFESLGANSLVKLVRRYLADHRDIFEDPDRRRKLVEVLELFSSAGWPDALKLLFELPDLLR
jgi:hypothetical protein